MSKIIEFPSASVRKDAELERGLREGLQGNGFSESAIETAISLAMPLFQEAKSRIPQNLKFNFAASFTDDQIAEVETQLSKVLEEHQLEVSRFIQKLVIKIAVLEAQANDV